MGNLSFENELNYLDENETVGGHIFLWIEWFRTRIILNQRPKVTWKWPLLV